MQIQINSKKHGVFTTEIDEEYVFLLEGRRLWVALEGTRKQPYVRIWDNGRAIPLARYITKAPKDCVVDHINRNTLDNRLINLRCVSIAENGRNRHDSIGGVDFRKNIERWRARTGKLHLGYFKTEEEARKFYFMCISKNIQTKEELRTIKNEWALNASFPITP